MAALDRFVTLNLVHPWRRFVEQHGERRLPILMYHSISDNPEPGRSSYYKVCTSPARFSAQMRWMADQGWKAVSLTEAWQALEARTAQDTKLAAITFDDGYRDFLTQAFPVLQKHRFSATMYVCPGLMEKDDACFNRRRLLAWPEVLELQKSGIEFGSHTVTHPELRRMDWKSIGLELTQSKSQLQERLQTEVSAFAYPYAFPQENATFVNHFAQLVAQTGYRTCVTTILGRAAAGSDPLRLPRLPANDADDDKLFAAKMDGSYDWLGRLQSLSRRLRSKLEKRQPPPKLRHPRTDLIPASDHENAV